MDLPVFANHRARHVAAANGRTHRRVGINAGTYLFRTLADVEQYFECIALGNAEGDTNGAEQVCGRLGDLAQRALRVAG